MALTPDDVLNKQFQHVRFKEGFDPDEVDDFLDEVVVEWRRILEENENLKSRVAELEAELAEARSSSPQTSASEAPVGATAPAALAAQPPQTLSQAQPAAQPLAGASADTTDAGIGSQNTSASAARIIERAQLLHDEHVAEGEARAAQIVAEANARADQIVSEAEANQREITARLDTERRGLEGRITELRHFERDYREQLRSYFEGKLKDLDAGQAGSDSPASAVGL